MSIKREEIRGMSFRDVGTGKRLVPVHAGEILVRDFIEPMGLTRYRVAKEIKVQQRRIDELCAERRGIRADTALRLGRLFGTGPELWMNLQAQYDLEAAERESGERIDEEVNPLAV